MDGLSPVDSLSSAQSRGGNVMYYGYGFGGVLILILLILLLTGRL
jgi:hypothetical protein